MKKASLLISTVLVFVLTTQTNAELPGWLDEVEVLPPNPCSSDVITITLSGWWPDSCVPNDSIAWTEYGRIFIDVIHDYPPGTGCLLVISRWKRTESVGPLEPGGYRIYTRLLPDFERYEVVAEFIVTDNQFVLSTESLTIREGRTASFVVSLLGRPDRTVQVTVAPASGDTDITVASGASLIFDEDNYWIAQPVTLAAAEDADYFDGETIISISADGYVPAELVARESDNDVPTILYVDDDAAGSNNGACWEDALASLQEALTVAAIISGVEEIRVAQGTYKPAGPAGDRNATFQLMAGIALKGGYAGAGEPDPDERNIHLYETILSGDLNSDDCPDFTNRSENSYHVVTASGVNMTATLDGFTVTAGNGDNGGGMYNYSASPTVLNCTFTDDSATYGGAVSSAGGYPSFTCCTFYANKASWGGAVHNANSHPALTNCIFYENRANHYGGAMYSTQISNNSFASNCTFVENSADEYGGAMFYQAASESAITDCIFWANSDSNGTDESAQIHGGGDCAIDYCCIQGWTGGLGGTGNFDADPCFVSGPLGDFCLGQVAAGQPGDSPCVDAGSAPAAGAGLDIYTTRTDRVGDAATVDMGYHYPSVTLNPADINGDGCADALDYAVLASQWQQPPGVPSADVAPPGGDGLVGGNDLGVLAHNWLWGK
jgi:hypothetical protein